MVARSSPELAALAREREQHGLLADACGALEKLRETGAASLFWGDRSETAGEDQVRRARGRATALPKHIGGIEDRRQALVDQISPPRDHQSQHALGGEDAGDLPPDPHAASVHHGGAAAKLENDRSILALVFARRRVLSRPS